jgi:hypothetical protein
MTLFDQSLTREDLDRAATEFAEQIRRAWGPPERWVPTSNPASLCGHPCPFFLWALRVRPMDLPEPWDGLPGIFKLGKEIERAVIRDVEEAGYEVTYEQVRFTDDDLGIVGYIDGYVRKRGHAVLHRPVPFEVKGVSPNYYVDATSFERLLAAPYWRMRLAPAQLLTYAAMAPEEHEIVCFIPRNKSNRQTDPFFEFVGDWKHILEQVAEVLTEVNRAMREDDEPWAKRYDPEWCDSCDAKAICPTMMSLRGGGKIAHLIDEKLDGLCSSMLDGHEGHKLYNRSKAKVKKYADGAGLYDVSELGEIRTIVTNEHRVSVEQKSNGKYLTVVSLADDTAEDEEVPE